MGVKVQVVFHSLYGHVFELAKAVAEGAGEVPGAEVTLARVAETLSDDVLAKMGATESVKAFADVPLADPQALGEADVVLLGTPTRYGLPTAQMQAFLDRTGGLWAKGALVGKVGGAFTSTATQHGGQETTLVHLHTFFYHQGMVVVGVPYAAPELSFMEGITGGTPYGASAIAGPKGERPVSDNERAIARYQGRHAASIGFKLTAR
jgi:NAD(P)H dehydrogenase (quinone)